MAGRPCRRVLAAIVGAALWTATPASWATDTFGEREQIAGVARDYQESWHTADSDRMERVLHPDMVKRYVDSLATGRQVVHSLTRPVSASLGEARTSSVTTAQSDAGRGAHGPGGRTSSLGRFHARRRNHRAG